MLAAWRAARRPGETLVVAGLAGADEDGDPLRGHDRARAEYRALLRRARAFVIAPRREDFGIAQLEALADGAQLVTTAAPGPYAALPLARALDPRLVGDDLAAALRTALDDPAPGYAERAAALLAPYTPAAVDALVAERLLPPSSTGRCRLSRAWRGFPDSERSEDGAEERGRGGGDEHADDHRQRRATGRRRPTARPAVSAPTPSSSPSASTWVTISAVNSAGASSAMNPLKRAGSSRPPSATGPAALITAVITAAPSTSRSAVLVLTGAASRRRRRTTRRGPARPAGRPGRARGR